MAQRNVEWYSVHTNSAALRQMAQRNVEWYSVHTNGVELHEMAQRNVEWYSVHTNGAASCRITLQNIRRSIWTLNFLALCEIFRCCGESSSLLVAWHEGYLAETTKNTANGTAIRWGHDVIECDGCRETITWCSRCVEESSLRLAVKQSQFSEFLLFSPADISFIRCRSRKR